MIFTERHRKVLHDFYHMDQQALMDLIINGLIELPLPGKLEVQFPPPYVTDKGIEYVKDWQVVD